MLAIFAHPDDEGAIGPLLVKYSKTHKVFIIVATDGRYGVRDHAGIPGGDSLAAVRKIEMECSCKNLGVEPPILLGFHDGMGMRTGVGEAFKQLGQLTEKLKEKIESINPDFIISFGPDGDTGHPDHRLIGNLTTQVILREGWAKKYPLYFLAWTKRQSQSAYPSNLNYMDSQYVNVAAHFDAVHETQAWRALQCHTSQFTLKEMQEWMDADKKDVTNVFYFRRFHVEQGLKREF